MDYTEIIYLVSETLEYDEVGNILPSSIQKNKVYAKKQSLRTNEFYNAIEVGLKPTCEFVVKKLNYNGETIIKWNNEYYSVIRTIDPKNKFDIVLVCEKKISDGRQESGI